jgi:diaminobutyrate-2-oxoglutarate transaminase
MMNIFENHESEVRSYCRSFPTVFTRAEGSELFDRQGKRYIDFFAGAGALNYGHNNPTLKRALIEYIEKDGVTHSLDMATVAKEQLLKTFHEVVLKPRGLNYKVQFPGPTGTNAVESALKLARKVTGRQNVICFTNGFHGMTLGSLAVTGNSFKRKGAGVPLSHTTPMPFDGQPGSLDYLESFLNNSSSGVDKPAAIILETVQAEGGINVASSEWLQRLEKIARRHEILLVVDDIQVGCGRTGKFFSFEEAGIKPDIVCLSKSISGYGHPMALVLFRPELDKWAPGEHNGTFRGFNLGFVTATVALSFWKDDTISKGVEERSKIVRSRLRKIAERHPKMEGVVKGRGLILGLSSSDHHLAGRVSKLCFEKGLIIETAGADDEVLKVLCPLNIPMSLLKQGLDILEEAYDTALASQNGKVLVRN